MDKDQSIRRVVIDRLLQRREGCSHSDMLEACNAEYRKRDKFPITSLNTIRTDIRYISEDLKAIFNHKKDKVIIENNRETGDEEFRKGVHDGRAIKYRYSDPNFTLFESPISASQLDKIEEMVDSLSMYEGRIEYGWISEIRARLHAERYSSESNVKPVVGFDDNENLKGREHFRPLLDYIKNEKVIKLYYKPYGKEEYSVIVHPYYLRQYNNRWFLLAEEDEKSRLGTYALDRISKYKESKIPYRKNEGAYDFEKYFDNFLGVTKNSKAELETIRIWSTEQQWNYLRTKPIHKSQNFIKKETNNNTKGVIFEIKVIPNRELEQVILSLGEEVYVKSPESFRNKIQERIKNTLNNYK